jgi:diaminohydroxyphosphoribosylaminopyrimidine deaminase/5-amino-6-(5-phosphoribosylamino)uracil reductase
VVAQTDPDQRVSGTGIGILRAAGVDVIVGVCEAEAKRLNEAYLHQRITGMPFVTLKTAITLDGKVATRSGDSRWITSPTTRKWAHRVLRNRADAIVVGVGTVIEDDPDLTVRLGHGAVRNPFRVVLDTRLRIPANSRIVTRAGQDGKTIVVHGGDAPSKARASLADAGVTLMEMPILDDGYGRRSIDVRALFQHLGTSGLATGVLVEGGATVAWDLMKSCLIDRYCWCVAPKIVGGAGAPSSVGGVGFERMADARPLRWESARRSGPDVIVFARPL